MVYTPPVNYSVKQLARKARISIRTLHHYDSLGLIKSASIGDNGYRYYSEVEASLLQQVLFFKESGFSLTQIKDMIYSPHYDISKSLHDQKHLLELQKERIDALIATIERELKVREGVGKRMDDTQLFDGFDSKKIDEFKNEAYQRWGNTNEYKQSMERMNSWSNEDFKRIGNEGKVIVTGIANFMDKSADSTEVQELVNKYHGYMNNFYDCSIEIFEGLGRGYVQDARFAAYFDNIKPGLALFMSQAIAAYINNQRNLL